MARDPQDPDVAAILSALHELVLADREAGSERAREAYQARFPGFELEVGQELDELARRASGDPASSGSLFPPLLDAGRVLGPHRLLKRLGRGGQGEVWAAHHGGLGRDVALKLLLDPVLAGRGARERFDLEGRVLAGLRHRSICRVHHVGVAEGFAYLSMDLLPGPSLAGALEARRAEGPPDAAWTRQAVVWCERLAEGLHSAHQGRVLHRDVKPANVLLDGEGWPVLVDFGLAKRLDDEGHGLTVTHASIGTRDYMSPEQLGGGAVPLDQRSDVYSLGLVLYELLTLEKAHHGAALTVRQGLAERPDPPPIRGRNPHVSRDLALVVRKAMAFERADRYDTAEELAADLARVRRGEPVAARGASAFTRTTRWARRNPVLALGLASVITILSVALGVVERASRREATQARRAEQETRRAERVTLSSLLRSEDLERTNQVLGRIPQESRGFAWGILRDLAYPHDAWAQVRAVVRASLILHGDDLHVASSGGQLARISTVVPWEAQVSGRSVDDAAQVALDPGSGTWVRSLQGSVQIGKVGNDDPTGIHPVPDGMYGGRPMLTEGGGFLWLQDGTDLGVWRDPASWSGPAELRSIHEWRDVPDGVGEILPLAAQPDGQLLALVSSAGGAGPAQLLRLTPDGEAHRILELDLSSIECAAVDRSGRVLAVVASEEGSTYLVRLRLPDGVVEKTRLPDRLDVHCLAVGLDRVVLGSFHGEVVTYGPGLEREGPPRLLLGGSVEGLLLHEPNALEELQDTLWVVTSSGLVHRIGFGPGAVGTPAADPRSEVADLLGLAGGRLVTRCQPRQYQGGSTSVGLWELGPGGRLHDVTPSPDSWFSGFSSTWRGRVWATLPEEDRLVWVGPSGDLGYQELERDPDRWWNLTPGLLSDGPFVLRHDPKASSEEEPSTSDRSTYWIPRDVLPTGPVELRPLELPDELVQGEATWGAVGSNLFLVQVGRDMPRVIGPQDDPLAPLARALTRFSRLPEEVVASRDGGRVLAVVLGGQAALSLQAFDRASGEPVGPPFHARQGCRDACLSADGSLASVLVQGTRLLVWDVLEGETLLDLDFRDYPLQGHLLDPDLGWIAVLGEDSRLHLLTCAPPDAPVWGGPSVR